MYFRKERTVEASAYSRLTRLVFRWLCDVVDYEVGDGLVRGFELEAELLLHRGEDGGPAFRVALGPFAANLKLVTVDAVEAGFVDDGRLHHGT